MPVLATARSGRGAIPGANARALRLGLVNNMPDAALARTERHFIDLLDAATPDLDIVLSFYSLPGLTRGELGCAHLARRGYRAAADAGAAGLDAMIVTGTEPKQPHLVDEPYWRHLAALFDWIRSAGPSTLFSCLAAHAAVLQFDGIERQRLAQKRCGVFEHAVSGDHPLVESVPASVRIAHSRWNEVCRETLENRGYQILTAAPDAGVDLFVKQSRNLLLFFQGHPEYDGGTLFREYRRDVQRFLTGENPLYPQAPQNYFDTTETDLLTGFRARAMAKPGETRLEDFPLARRASGDTVSPMAGVLRTWLWQIAGAKRTMPVVAAPAATPRFGHP